MGVQESFHHIFKVLPTVTCHSPKQSYRINSARANNLPSKLKYKVKTLLRVILNVFILVSKTLNYGSSGSLSLLCFLFRQVCFLIINHMIMYVT